MPLTADDVVQKRFNPTKFREGYDQDEVDDFLDEVVTELRRLNEETEDLRRQLSQCEGRVSELSGGTGEGATAATESQTGTDTSGEAPASAPVAAKTPAAAEKAPAAAASTVDTSGTATPAGTADVSGMLALAQRLHDEHVRNGEQERDRLVAEAQEKATRLVHEAEEKQAETLGTLEQQRSVLERTIDELRGFERDYRSRLKSYLENQLRELDTKGQVVPGRTPGATGSRAAGDDGAASGGFPLGGKS